MARIYEYLSYRKWIKDEATEWKKRSPSHTLARLSNLAQVQAPYLTNVLKERAHLNGDQFFAVAQVFSLNLEEIQFGQTLLEWERSSYQKRKDVLKGKLEEAKKLKLTTETYLKARPAEATADQMTRYYLSPELQLIHSFLAIEKYAKNLDLIASSLNLTSSQVVARVKELIELGFVKSVAKGFEKTKKTIHLNKDSPLCRPQQLLMQRHAQQQLQLLSEGERYNFAVTFTACEETREKIQQEFLKFLSTIEESVRKAPSEEVYQMTFDLFPWSRPTVRA